MANCVPCSAAFRGKGQAWIAEYPGESNPFRKLGNVTVLSYETSTSTESIPNMTTPGGGTCATAMMVDETTCTIETTDAACVENAALGMLGISVERIAGTLITAEEVNSYHGSPIWVSRMPDPAVAVIVEDITDTTTYVLNTDYVVDADTGYITTLSTGAITDGQVLHITYTTTSSFEITALQAGFKDYAIKFIGVNEFNGKRVESIWYKAKLSAAAAKSMISAEHVVLSLTGTLQNDPLHDGAPYQEVYQA